MIILTKYFSSTPLLLEAYSFNPAEFNSLENVLKKAVEKYHIRDIPNDSDGRRGREYTVPFVYIQSFEDYLGVKFSSEKIESDEKGRPYRCEELGLRGNAKGCETFYAKDGDRARVKCSMTIAPKNGWFSGEAKLGECKKKSFFW